VSRWQPDDDQPYRDTVAQFTSAFPLWWVMWRTYARRFCGFWCGNGAVPPQEHTDPAMLARQWRHVEHQVAAGYAP
jgi:hypothetical protein